MATTLTVLLAGVNKTSPVVKQVQKDIEKLGGTVSVFNKKQQKETKETEVGFEKVGKVLKGFGGVAREAAEGGGLLGRALGLLGVGGIAGLATAGIGAVTFGALKLAEGYGKAALALRDTSEASGFTEASIELIGAGAKRAGVDVKTTQGALYNFSQALFHAAYEGGPASVAFTKMGVDLSKVRDGTLSTEDAFYRYQDAIRQQVNPATQQMLAQLAGVQDLMPAIRHNLIDLENAAKDAGDELSPGAREKAKELGVQLLALHSATDALGTEFEEVTVGPLTRLVEGLAAAIKYAKGAADSFSEFQKEAADAEAHGKSFYEFMQEKGKNAHAGPDTGIGATGVPLPRSALGPQRGHPTADPDDVAAPGEPSKSLIDRLSAIKGAAGQGATEGSSGDIQKLMALGWTQQQAEGLEANVIAESGGKANAVGDNGAAYGLFQWHKDRQEAFNRWAGHDIRGSSKDEQLAFADYELRQGGEKAAGDRLKAQTTARESGATVSRYYERPADAEGGAANRGSLAQKLDDESVASRFYPKQAAPVQTAQTPDKAAPEYTGVMTDTGQGWKAETEQAPDDKPPTAQQLDSQARAADASKSLDRMQLDIQMSNVQPGTEVTARDGNGKNIPARVQYSMDPGLVTGY